MSNDKCPKCGSECTKIATSFLWESFDCGTELHADGQIVQSKDCRISELEEKHRKLVEAAKFAIEEYDNNPFKIHGKISAFCECGMCILRKAVRDER